MVRLEDFMEIQQLHHDGVSVSEIARRLNMDRKTVRKYLGQVPRAYERKAKSWKIDPFRAYLRERWELGVQNAARLFTEIQKRRHLWGSHNLPKFNGRSVNACELLRLAALIIVAIGILPSTLSAQNAARALRSDVELPDAPGIGNGFQASDTLSSTLESSASVTGTVLDPRGSVIPKAQVKLLGPRGVVERLIETDVNGRFTFAGLTGGTFRVQIESAGLATFISAEIVLVAGDKCELPDMALSIATANTDVQVYASREEIAEAQVQLAEKQRVLGILPNFYSSYIWDAAPLTPKLKFDLALRSTLDPVTFFVTGGLAGVEQAHNTFPGYGAGPEGYAKRYGAAYADNIIGRMIGSAILPSVFYQDPRYFYKGTGSIASRALYALGATVIARGDNGRSQPNYSHILGNFAAAGISNLYRSSPDRNATLTLRNGLIITGSNAVANLVREFILRKITLKVPAFEQGKP